MQATFYYDLGNPECYLVAERISAVLPVAARWEPVYDRRLGAAALDRASIERLARERGLQPIRWPARWPPDSELAMRAATYAKGIGRAAAFSLAAFRQAFAAGRDLSEEDTVVIAAAACEMHPAAVLKGVTLHAVRRSLAGATAGALAAGVKTLPAVRVGELLFEGETALERAAAALPVS